MTINRPCSNGFGNRMLADLAIRIDAEHSEVATALQSALSHAIAAGEMLIEAKREVKRRNAKWLPWLAANCSVPARTASHYVWLAKRRADLCNENGNVLPISVTQAMDQLKHPAGRGGINGNEWGDYVPVCREWWGRPAWRDFNYALRAVTEITQLNPPAPRHVVKAARAGKTPGLTAEGLRETIALLARYADALEPIAHDGTVRGKVAMAATHLDKGGSSAFIEARQRDVAPRTQPHDRTEGGVS